MKNSGSKTLTIEAKTSFKLSDYADAHATRDCKGTFEFVVAENVPYPIDALGPVLLPLVPHIVCEECSTAYPVPGWDEFLDRHLSLQLIVNGRLLTKAQMRFLRLATNLSQVQIADSVGMDRSLFNKKESPSNQAHQFNPSEQVQLKMLYASKLGIEDAKYLYEHIMKLDETPGKVTLPREEVENFPPIKQRACR